MDHDHGKAQPGTGEPHEKIRQYLATVKRVAVEGDDGAALAIARGELPLIIETFDDLIARHRSDAAGFCRACGRTGRWWSRHRMPCAVVRRVRGGLLRAPVGG